MDCSPSMRSPPPAARPPRDVCPLLVKQEFPSWRPPSRALPASDEPEHLELHLDAVRVLHAVPRRPAMQLAVPEPDMACPPTRRTPALFLTLPSPRPTDHTPSCALRLMQPTSVMTTRNCGFHGGDVGFGERLPVLEAEGPEDLAGLVGLREGAGEGGCGWC